MKVVADPIGRPIIVARQRYAGSRCPEQRVAAYAGLVRCTARRHRSTGSRNRTCLERRSRYCSLLEPRPLFKLRLFGLSPAPRNLTSEIVDPPATTFVRRLAPPRQRLLKAGPRICWTCARRPPGSVFRNQRSTRCGAMASGLASSARPAELCDMIRRILRRLPRAGVNPEPLTNCRRRCTYPRLLSMAWRFSGRSCV